MTFSNNLHFLRPWWLLALPVVVYFSFALKNYFYRQNPWQTICDPHLLKHLVCLQTKGWSRWPQWLFLFACMALVLALAGPSWEQKFDATYKIKKPLIVALDLSSVMNATDISPDRITRARYKLTDILNALRENEVGLVAFSSEAYVASPLTEDANTILNMVPELSPQVMPVDGANLTAAMQACEKLLQNTGVNRGEILLITANNATAKDVEVAARLAAKHYHVSILAVGKELPVPMGDKQGWRQDSQGQVQMSRLDLRSLGALAQAGQGRLVQFSDDNADINQLKTLWQSHLTDQRQPKFLQAAAHRYQQDDGYGFIWLIIPAFLFLFRRGSHLYV
jgi:Ca-activated chloride channel family protein